VLKLLRQWLEAGVMEEAELRRPVTTQAQAHFERLGVGRAFMGEHELALGIAHYALRSLGCNQEEADQAVEAVRRGVDATPASSVG
jgi:hypothetical protein